MHKEELAARFKGITVDEKDRNVGLVTFADALAYGTSEREAGRAEYGALLALAVKIIEGLADQQGMPDDSYLPDFEIVRKAASATAGMQPCPECLMDTRFHADDCKYHYTAYERGFQEGRIEGLDEAAGIAHEAEAWTLRDRIRARAVRPGSTRK